MAYTLIWSPTARFDLWDVLSYISEFDPEAASRFGQYIFDSIDRLADFPGSGRIVPEFEDPAIREIICKPCRIVYRLKQDENLAEIARVWHAARGIPEM
ncbi:MAG: type II toxin-antitoxin system RelE/ParE family toxin [Verrucomicrobiota bacterium]